MGSRRAIGSPRTTRVSVKETELELADAAAVVCGWCHYCRRGEPLYCENFSSAGVTCDGGFAEYFKWCVGTPVRAHASPSSKCFPINNLTDEEATLIEPASCAVHGMDRLKMPFGAKVLLIGAGPTGLILAQLMKVSQQVRLALTGDRRRRPHHHRGEQRCDTHQTRLTRRDQDGHCSTDQRSGRLHRPRPSQRGRPVGVDQGGQPV